MGAGNNPRNVSNVLSDEKKKQVINPVKAGKQETGKSSLAALSAEHRWILSKSRVFRHGA